MPMPPDVESYLRSLAHRFNEPDLREVANEIKRLTAELAKWQEQAEVNKHDAHNFHDIVVQKDKRIEELLEAEIEPIVGVFRNGHLVTYKQIDAAWEFNEDSSPEIKAHGRAMLYSCFKVDACEKCGGSGIPTPYEVGSGESCPTCHGHGWIITSQLVDKCGRFGTGDADEK